MTGRLRTETGTFRNNWNYWNSKNGIIFLIFWELVSNQSTGTGTRTNSLAKETVLFS